jgi:hypothetical protein
MPIQEKQRLRAYFARHKNIPLNEFSAIIRGEDVKQSRCQKRPAIAIGKGESANPLNIRGKRYYDRNGIAHYAPSENSFLPI